MRRDTLDDIAQKLEPDFVEYLRALTPKREALAVARPRKSKEASPMKLSLNQILPWLREIDALRRALAA